MIVALFAAFGDVLTSLFQNIGVVKYGPVDAVTPTSWLVSPYGAGSSVASSSVTPSSVAASPPATQAVRTIGKRSMSRIAAVCAWTRAPQSANPLVQRDDLGSLLT